MVNFKPTVTSIIGTFFVFAITFSLIAQPCDQNKAYCYDENENPTQIHETFLSCAVSCDSTTTQSIINAFLKIILPILIPYIAISIIQSKWMTSNTQ